MRRWKWEIRRAADEAESYRSSFEDWDAEGDVRVYPPLRRASFRELWACVHFAGLIDDECWGRRVWVRERMAYRWTARHWALWAAVRSALGVLVCRWERWREPDWLKDPNTVLYFKPEGEA